MKKKNIFKITIEVKYNKQGEIISTVIDAHDDKKIRAVEALYILNQAAGQILDEIT